jgi:hypothetical protein
MVIHANSYYGSEEELERKDGTGTDAILAREVKNKMQRIGTVVVQIVNRSGVIAAKPKGTTNTNPCLIEAWPQPENKWQPDSNAPETQIGFITVNFKLANK